MLYLHPARGIRSQTGENTEVVNSPQSIVNSKGEYQIANLETKFSEANLERENPITSHSSTNHQKTATDCTAGTEDVHSLQTKVNGICNAIQNSTFIWSMVKGRRETSNA
jgi:hypothetical protein